MATSPFFYIPFAPNVWEALGRVGSVPWVVPLREEANLFGAGFDYRIGKTDLHVEQSYQTYNNPANLQGFSGQAFPVLGPSSPTSNLLVQNWNTLSAFNIPTTSIHLDQEVTGRLQFRVGYIYSNASGPASFNGTVAQPGSTIPPFASLAQQSGFSLNYLGFGTTKVINQTADAGFTLKLFEPVELMSDYRYQSYSENGAETMQTSRSDLPGQVFPVQNDTTRWEFGFHTVDTVLNVTPLSTLTIRAGVRFIKEDIDRKEDGVTDIGTARTKSYSPLVSAAWTPSKKFSLRGNFESRVTVDPYVRITPESIVGATIRTKVSLSDRLGHRQHVFLPQHEIGCHRLFEQCPLQFNFCVVPAPCKTQLTGRV